MFCLGKVRRNRNIDNIMWLIARRYVVEQLNHTNKLYKKKYTESIVKSQNIVEQANSNPNNISPTMSRRHIICKSSSVAEMNHKFHS